MINTKNIPDPIKKKIRSNQRDKKIITKDIYKRKLNKDWGLKGR